jgi:hypothetical protein
MLTKTDLKTKFSKVRRWNNTTILGDTPFTNFRKKLDLKSKKNTTITQSQRERVERKDERGRYHAITAANKIIQQ